MSQQTVARSQERRAEKDKKEKIGGHCTVARQGYMLGPAAACSEAEDAEDCAGEKVCRGAVGQLEMQERLASFQACQTAALNLHKKTLQGSLEPP